MADERAPKLPVMYRIPNVHGNQLVKYEVLEDISTANGYFSKMYTVRESQSNQQYLLKEVRLKGLSNTDRDYRQQELKTCRGLQHEHVLRYVNGYENEEKVIIVFEQVLCSLQSLLQSKGKAPSQLLFIKWTYHIASALKYIHEDYKPGQPLVHRNLKPANIMVTDKYLLKLSDFGIAKTLTGNDTLTSIVGTAVIISPEMMSREPYNSKTDIWSFGVTAVYIATLQYAVQASSLETIFRKTSQGEVCVLSDQYCAKTRAIVNEMLQPDPKSRPSAGTVVKKLLSSFKHCESPPDPDDFNKPSSNPLLNLPVTPENILVTSVTTSVANTKVDFETLSIEIVIRCVLNVRKDHSNRPKRGEDGVSLKIPISVQQELLVERPKENRFAGDPICPVPKTRTSLNIQQTSEFVSESNCSLINTFPGAFGVNRRDLNHYRKPLPPIPNTRQPSTLYTGDSHTKASTLPRSSGDSHTKESTIHRSSGDSYTKESTIHRSSGDSHTKASTLHRSSGDSHTKESTVHRSSGDSYTKESTVPRSSGDSDTKSKSNNSSKTKLQKSKQPVQANAETFLVDGTIGAVCYQPAPGQTADLQMELDKTDAASKQLELYRALLSKMTYPQLCQALHYMNLFTPDNVKDWLREQFGNNDCFEDLQEILRLERLLGD